MKKGYCVGKNASFLPSADADWIEDFNTMLADSNMSRNAFTEMLIREAVRVRIGLTTNNPSGISSTIVDTTAAKSIDTKLNEILQAIKNQRVYTPEPTQTKEIIEKKTDSADQPQQEDPQDILVARLNAISPK